MLGNNMFAYCQNSPISFKDDAGTRMEYYSFDSGAPCGFPGSSTASAQTAGRSINADTKENVSKRLIKDIQSICEAFVDFYFSPIVQRPIGEKNLISGTMRIRAGFEVLIAPDPTLLDEVCGYGAMFKGFFEVIKGIKKIYNAGKANGDSIKTIINTIFEEVR